MICILAVLPFFLSLSLSRCVFVPTASDLLLAAFLLGKFCTETNLKATRRLQDLSQSYWLTQRSGAVFNDNVRFCAAFPALRCHPNSTTLGHRLRQPLSAFFPILPSDRTAPFCSLLTASRNTSLSVSELGKLAACCLFCLLLCSVEQRHNK